MIDEYLYLYGSKKTALNRLTTAKGDGFLADFMASPPQFLKTITTGIAASTLPPAKQVGF